MTYLLYHALDLWSVLHLNSCIQLAKTQRLNRSELSLRSLNCAAGLRNSHFCHDSYPLKTFDNSNPLLRAMEYASRMLVNALKVAFTTLCGFEEPLDLANTL